MSASINVEPCELKEEQFLAVGMHVGGDIHHTGKFVEEHHRKSFVGYRGGKAAARVSVYFNEAMQWEHKTVAQLGNFESIDDKGLVKALLGAAFSYANSVGAAYCIGPMNGSTWEGYRFVTQSDGTPPYMGEPTHPSYYPKLWEAAGMNLFQSYYSSESSISITTQNTADFFSTNRLTLCPIVPENLRESLELLYPLCSSAFSKSPLFTPISQDAFVARYEAYAPLLSGGTSAMIVDEHGRPLIFCLTMPDRFDASGSTLIFKTLAKDPACHLAGLADAFVETVIQQSAAQNFTRLIHAFMHEENKSLEHSAHFGGSPFRRYGLYIS